MVDHQDRTTELWTGEWMAGPDGPVPVVIRVPTGRHINNGRGERHYLAKGFKLVSQIPQAGPDDALRLAGGQLPRVEQYLSAMEDRPDAARRRAGRKEKPCSPPKE